MILSIEDLMYQLGGQLPSIAQDSILSAQLAQMQGQAIPFTQRAQELGPSEFYTYLDKQRLLDNQKSNQKTAEAASKRAEISNSLKTLGDIQKTLDTDAKSVTGLPLYFKEAQKIDSDIKQKMAILENEIFTAKSAISTGKDVGPETLENIVKLKGEIQNIMSSPQYSKLASFSPIIKEQMKVMSKYNNDPDYIVDDEKYKNWVTKINDAIASGEGLDTDQLGLERGTIVDKKALDKTINTMIDDYIEDNTSLKTILTPMNMKSVLEKSKQEITDLTDIEQATEFMLGYIKSSPGGEVYTQEVLGGDDGLRKILNAKLRLANKNPGGVSTQTVDSGTMVAPLTDAQRAERARQNAEIRSRFKEPTKADDYIAEMQSVYGSMGLVVGNPVAAAKPGDIGGFTGEKLLDFTPKIVNGASDPSIQNAITTYNIMNSATGKQVTVEELKRSVATMLKVPGANTVQTSPSSTGTNRTMVDPNSNTVTQGKETPAERAARIKASLQK